MGRFEEIKQRASIKEYADGNLEPRGNNKYVCPICGSGNGPNRSAALTIQPDKGRWKCFSCERGGDIFDLVGAMHGTEDKQEQLRLVASWFGLEDDARGREGRSKTTEQAATGKRPDRIIEDHTEGRAASRRYMEAMRENITDPDAIAYLEFRGLTLEDARRFGLGYDPDAGGARDARGQWCRRGRIVIPWRGTDYYHIDRSIDPTAKDGKYSKPKTDDVGQQPLWNRDVIGSGRPYFVVEGALDALAIEIMGGEAVALGGTGFEQFAQEAALHKKKTIPILMLDRDNQGERAQADLVARLDKEGVSHLEVLPLYGKDAGDCLVNVRDDMTEYIGFVVEEAAQEAAHVRERAYNEALHHLQVKRPDGVVASILNREGMHETISTGLAGLDIALGGGLPSTGLVVVGAISSSGKTTLVVQIADHMAAEGRSVLFATIEQSAQEIAAKSLSRLMAERTREDGSKVKASAQHILDGRQRRRWLSADPEKQTALEAACEAYDATIAPNLRILEGIKQPSVADVRSVAERMAEHDGQAPVVAIDYLQLMRAQDERDTDKRAVDKNIMSLRQLARDLDTLVIAISSLNRASYTGAVDMAAFKESGSIEFSADLLIGLQPQGMTDDLEGKTDATRANEAKKRMREFKRAVDRHAEIVILKNRNGPGSGSTVPLRYDVITNTFTDDKEQRL